MVSAWTWKFCVNRISVPVGSFQHPSPVLVQFLEKVDVYGICVLQFCDSGLHGGFEGGFLVEEGLEVCELGLVGLGTVRVGVSLGC
jgi:hypothetical protein